LLLGERVALTATHRLGLAAHPGVDDVLVHALSAQLLAKECLST
jgi:hypothetical protein